MGTFMFYPKAKKNSWFQVLQQGRIQTDARDANASVKIEKS